MNLFLILVKKPTKHYTKNQKKSFKKISKPSKKYFNAHKIFLVIMTFIFPYSALAQEFFFIENFESDQIGNLPSRWYNLRGNAQPIFYKDNHEYQYKVEKEEGNLFLRYSGTEAKHLSFLLNNEEGINIHNTPILTWRWRVYDLPEGADENSKKLNDTAASIYVVFDMGRVFLKKVPKSIRYTWSSTLPIGTELSKFYGNQKIIVVGSGEKDIGKWITFERNIVEDYIRVFGDNPPSKPLAILILSDGNDTKDSAKADYDNILLKSHHSN